MQIQGKEVCLRNAAASEHELVLHHYVQMHAVGQTFRIEVALSIVAVRDFSPSITTDRGSFARLGTAVVPATRALKVRPKKKEEEEEGRRSKKRTHPRYSITPLPPRHVRKDKGGTHTYNSLF